MKIWSLPGDDEWLRLTQKRIFTNGPDLPAHQHIGYFMTWYAGVELRITMMLSQATNIPVGPNFELLTWGMDARVKVDRFRRAAEGRIGPNLESRLDFFYNTARDIRNKLAHQFPTYNAKREVIQLATINKMARPDDRPLWDGVEKVFEIPLFEFFELAAWLEAFMHDLETVKHPLKSRGIFEINEPRSPLPPEPDQSHAKPKKRATPYKRDRKQARKALRLRAKESR